MRQTQEQIDEIEGTDTKAEEALADATEAAVSDSSGSDRPDGAFQEDWIHCSLTELTTV